MAYIHEQQLQKKMHKKQTDDTMASRLRKQAKIQVFVKVVGSIQLAIVFKSSPA